MRPTDPGLFPTIASLFGIWFLAAATGAGQVARRESILPSQTDGAISAWNQPHLVMFAPQLRPGTSRRNQLVLYLHGQGGTGSGASELLQTAAEEGFHAIGLTYPNDWSPFTLCAGDPLCPERVRLELLQGVDHSPLIAVPRSDSVESRVIRLLQHVSALHPGEDWAQFVADGSVVWDRVVLWGHSQGGGNAGVIARHHRVARVCLSAPAADGGPGSPALWWASHQTPSQDYVGFCHAQDALAAKVAFWNALGMAEYGPVIDVAAATPPFSSTHSLSTSISPAVQGQYHNSVVADNVTPRSANNQPVYKPVWRYMMTADLAEGGQPQVWNDVVYATVPTFNGPIDLHMDIYSPTSGASGSAPLIVWIHGGGWQSGSHDTIPSVALAMRAQGYAVASVEYRLSSEAISPAQLHDCKGAIRFLRANAEAYGIDPSRIGVWGSSAGGHLVSLLGTSWGVDGAEGEVGGNQQVSSRVQAVADYFGPTDFFGVEGWHTQCTPTNAESALLGACLGEIQAHAADPAWQEIVARTRLAAPLTHVSRDDPAFHIAHGSIDTTVWPEHSENLHAALLAAGVTAQFRLVPGFGHGLPTSESAFVYEFFARLVGPGRCPADIDEDGLATNPSGPDGAVDINDLLSFLSLFELGDPRGDLDNDGESGVGTPDGAVDVADLLFFLARFEAGC